MNEQLKEATEKINELESAIKKEKNKGKLQRLIAKKDVVIDLLSEIKGVITAY